MRLFTKLTIAAVAAASSALVAAEVIDLTSKDLWIPMKNVEFSEGKMVNNGRVMYRSKKLITIDPAKKYTIKMTVSAPDAKRSSTVLFGMYPANAKGQLIPARFLQSNPGTLTQVVETAAKGSTAIKVKDGSKWSKSPSSALIAYDVKADNSDVPCYRIIGNQIVKSEKDGDVWVLTLKKPLTKDLTANSYIRQHSDGGYFYFGNRQVGSKPATVSTTVTGRSGYGHYNPAKGFHPGMTHAYLVILSDWYNAKNKVEFKDATLTIE